MAEEDNELSGQQATRIDLAANVTSHQIPVVVRLLDEMHMSHSPENKLAMLQILATNYLAEVNRRK